MNEWESAAERCELVEVSIANFRSIGKEPVSLWPKVPVHVFVGKNNSGKSNILRAVTWLSRGFAAGTYGVDELDHHGKQKTTPIEIAAKVSVLEEHWRGSGDPTAELRFSGGQYSGVTPGRQFDAKVAHAVLPEAGRRIIDENVFATQLVPILLRKWLPSIATVGEFRKLTPGDGAIPTRAASAEHLCSGQGLVETLWYWRDPDKNDRDQEKFRAIEELTAQLLDMPGTKLSITPARQLIVEHAGLRLPIASYGTGVHQSIILATAALSEQCPVLAIEEPEIHMHPLLQKKLLRFLLECKGKRFFISTHSPAFVDLVGSEAAVIHVWGAADGTKSRRVLDAPGALDALGDIGIRASDLLQANSVIWVEGPSDRVYIQKWLAFLDPRLREGIEYSLVPYGGANRRHLSFEREPGAVAGDPGLEGLIALLKVNQHSTFVADSDRDSETSLLKEGLTKLLDACGKSGVPCWVTWGRTIENYLPDALLQRVCKKTPGKAQPAVGSVSLGRYQPFQEALEKANPPGVGWFKDRDKVGRARRICGEMAGGADLEQGDLEDRLQELVAFIRKANGLT